MKTPLLRSLPLGAAEKTAYPPAASGLGKKGSPA